MATRGLTISRPSGGEGFPTQISGKDIDLTLPVFPWPGVYLDYDATLDEKGGILLFDLGNFALKYDGEKFFNAPLRYFIQDEAVCYTGYVGDTDRASSHTAAHAASSFSTEVI